MTQPNHDNTYTYHAPSGNKDVFYTAIRSKAKELAILLDQVCPDTNERAMAHNNLQQAIMWANAAIARHPEVELQDAIHAVMPEGLTWVGPNGRRVEVSP